MSPEANTPDQTTPSKEHNPWSKEAHDAEVEANRPTADNPAMFDSEDALVNARFSEIPGETLSGLVIGYYFEGDQKMNIVELSRKSREARAAEGIDAPTMIVPESAIASLEHARTSETPRERATENVGETAVAATTLGPDIDSPDMDEHGRTFLTKAQIQAARRDANVPDVGFAPTRDEISAMMNPTPEAEIDKGTTDVVDVNPYDAWVNGQTEGSVEAAAVRPELTEEERGIQAMRRHNEKLNMRDQINNRAEDRKAH
jgi:hypothetical protein